MKLFDLLDMYGANALVLTRDGVYAQTPGQLVRIAPEHVPVEFVDAADTVLPPSPAELAAETIAHAAK